MMMIPTLLLSLVSRPLYLAMVVILLCLAMTLSSCETMAVAGYVAGNAHVHRDPPGVFVSLPIIPIECGCQVLTHERKGLETLIGNRASRESSASIALKE